MKKTFIFLASTALLSANIPTFKTICNNTLANSSQSQIKQMCDSYGYKMKQDINVQHINKYRTEIQALASKLEVLTGKEVLIDYQDLKDVKNFSIKLKVNNESFLYQYLKHNFISSYELREVFKPFVGLYFTKDYNLLSDLILEIEGNVNGHNIATNVGISDFKISFKFNNMYKEISLKDININQGLFNLIGLSVNEAYKKNYSDLKMDKLSFNYFNKTLTAKNLNISSQFKLEDIKEALLVDVKNKDLIEVINNLKGLSRFKANINNFYFKEKGRDVGIIEGAHLNIDHESDIKINLKVKELNFARNPIKATNRAYFKFIIGESKIYAGILNGKLRIQFNNLNVKNNKALKYFSLNNKSWVEELDKELSSSMKVLNGKTYEVDVLGITLEKGIERLMHKIELDLK